MIAAFRDTYKFNYGEIFEEVDASWRKIVDMMEDALRKVTENHERNRKTLIVVHYGGHGVEIGGLVSAVCNHQERKK